MFRRKKKSWLTRNVTKVLVENKNLLEKSEIENALSEWFSEKWACSVPISGSLLNQKTGDLACQFSISDFKATNGWLCRWKERNQIYLKKNYGEASDVDETSASSWKSNVLPALLKDYSSSCIYNCDETALIVELFLMGGYELLRTDNLCQIWLVSFDKEMNKMK